MSVETKTRPLAPPKSTKLSGGLTNDEALRAIGAGSSETKLTNGDRPDCPMKLGETCLLKVLINKGTNEVTAKDGCDIPGFNCTGNLLDGAKHTADAILKSKKLTGL